MVRRLLLALAFAALAVLAAPAPAGAAPSAAPVKFYVVRDSFDGQPEYLFEIAERFLGSGDRNDEIFQLNKGRLQPDGLRLTDPGTLLPGWVLRLPADAKGAGVRTGPLPGPSAGITSAFAAQAPVLLPRGSGERWKWALLATGGVLLLGCTAVAWWLWLRRPAPDRGIARRPARAIAAVAALAAVIMAAGATLLLTADPPPPAYASTIVAADPTLCLTANAASDGAPLSLRPCTGGLTQQWQVTGDGTIRSAGHCMDVADAKEAMGTPVQIAFCNGNPAQQFRFDGDKLVTLLTGACVDVRGGRVVAGVAAIVQPCASLGDRTWRRPS
ncbi:ricin-type beta-trefoil lectin domain protein [Pseudosporangium ferrugineum]|uniref:Ricin-type beta-trefoil lectin protein n=1 Tax=Pseudosporangium ferrugineum TaxID=439699 RepID=A0A2T0SDN8_9ACTN|nr:ricin-type beta-trefoil lectin domain protein [Pseudosporangium ferrugineum]PRY31534.1 ricin-type beta-trefoil lectin protein [Pseudosporangium ferrugineum]